MKKLYILFLLCSFISFSQSPGDIIITEIMNNPLAVDDGFGEYVELYNTTGSAIDINGWSLKDQGSDDHLIDNGGPVIIPAGGYITLGRGGVTDDMDPDYNGGINHAYVYSDYFLGNGSDEVLLETPGAVVIDIVIYDNGATFPDPTGASMQLNSDFLNATANDTGSNWCESTTVFGPGDFGTPGVANATCAAVCEANLGASDATCDTIGSGATDDTYTATLAFSGTATGEDFVVTTTAGVVDATSEDPTTVSDGTIVISGIPEGTDITITVDNTADSGLCSLTRDISSPVCLPTGSVDLELIGVIDFSIPEESGNTFYGVSGAQGKGVHVVATANIADLSVYGIGVANNGGGTDGQEYTFPAVAVSAGDNILVVRSIAAMTDFMTPSGIALFDLVTEENAGDIAQNGDDAIELFKNTVLVETFGDPNCDPNSTPAPNDCPEWEYTDAWSYKNTLGSVWPTGWSYGAVNCTDFPNDTAVEAWTINDIDVACVYPFLAPVLSNDQFSSKELSIYPNPVSSGKVNIKSQQEGTKDIVLYDIMGRTVMNTKLNTETLDVSAIKTGMYLLKVTIEGRSTVTKLVIK